MEPRTDTVNSQSWLRGNRITLRPYIEGFMPTVSISKESITPQNLYEELRKVSIRYQRGTPILIEPQLHQELQSWDALSDEALINFEQELG
jgi:hypothetical protein